MITVLKGSPQYSIDNNGIMTIGTTWMLLPDSSADGTSSVNWLIFEGDVEKWAGNIGDNYKKPIIPDSGREATEFEYTNTFFVSDISYSCAEGRTHYEVSFTNEQNVSVMKMAGNVSAEINENNEKTKTINYILNVASDDPLAIDGSFIFSGTPVTWAGADYLVSSSSYNAVSKTRYELTITAQDMSVMMIGKPSKEIDAFGQKTMSAVWRYSALAYSGWTPPEEGTDASAYLGLGLGSGYIVTDVSAEPNGVLGYNVTINAKHVSKRLVKASKQEARKPAGDGYYTTHNIQYQSDVGSIDDFSNIVGEPTSMFIADATGRVTEVSIDENGKNDYDIQITTTDEPQSSSSVSSGWLQQQVDISASQGEFVLDPRQAGWFQGISGEYYHINFPPRTKFSYTLSPQSLNDMRTVDGGTSSSSDILNALKNEGLIGYDRIVGAQATDNNTLKWLSKEQIRKLTSLDNVHAIKVEGFVYAQAYMTANGESLRNLTFEPWEVLKHSPVCSSSQWPKGAGGRDMAFNKVFLTYKIRYMDFSVGINYKGNVQKILKNDIDYYYERAVKNIQSSAFTSYKGAGINFNETTDDSGTKWTQVTCTISALLRNGYSLVWNAKYDDSYVKNNSGSQLKPNQPWG